MDEKNLGKKRSFSKQSAKSKLILRNVIDELWGLGKEFESKARIEGRKYRQWTVIHNPKKREDFYEDIITHLPNLSITHG